MRRQYLRELKDLGYSSADIARETGLSQSKLSRISRGARPLLSTSPEYEPLRNAVRRLSYRELIKGGLSPEDASARRRVITDPSRPAPVIRGSRTVHHPHSKTATSRFQLRILGKFYNPKIKVTAFKQGFSFAYQDVDYEVMEPEAVREAQSRLGSSNWILQQILEREIITYTLAAQSPPV